MTQTKHIGSSFDDFLEEEGLLEEVESVAAKRVFVFQLEKELKKQKIRKDELAEMMGTSRSAIRRLFDPNAPFYNLWTNIPFITSCFNDT